MAMLEYRRVYTVPPVDDSEMRTVNSYCGNHHIIYLRTVLPIVQFLAVIKFETILLHYKLKLISGTLLRTSYSRQRNRSIPLFQCSMIEWNTKCRGCTYVYMYIGWHWYIMDIYLTLSFRGSLPHLPRAEKLGGGGGGGGVAACVATYTQDSLYFKGVGVWATHQQKYEFLCIIATLW